MRMNFKGHALVILESGVKARDVLDKRVKYTSWVLDKTDFCIYAVSLNRAKVAISKQLIGRMSLDRRTGNISFTKLKPIPVKILKKAEIEARVLYNLMEK